MQRENRRGGPREGAGRPPKPKGEKQGQRIMVNLTVDELRKVKAAAGDQSLGGFIRDVLMRFLDRRRGN